jgi:hypothetical protein
MRLTVVESGHSPEAKEIIVEIEARLGHVDDIDRTLLYRPELFGGPFNTVMRAVMRGPSDWSPGERELFAAFVSAQNQCPF